MPEPPNFRALSHRTLAAAGLRGPFVEVILAPAGLLLASAAGERLEIPFAAIDRIRFGYETSRLGGRFYQMRVWSNGARDPLVLFAAGRDASPGYAAVARAAAAAVAARRGMAGIEGGLGWGGALYLPLLLLPFLAYAGWASLQGFVEGFPLLFLIVLPAVLLLVGGTVGYGFLRLWRPRRLESLAELEPFVSKDARPWLF
jgi:hypothetical protein